MALVDLPAGMQLVIDGETVIVQGHQQCLVESKSVADTHHTVEWDEEWRRWSCTCKGFEVRHQCRHARAINRWMAGTADVRFRSDPS